MSRRVGCANAESAVTASFGFMFMKMTKDGVLVKDSLSDEVVT